MCFSGLYFGMCPASLHQNVQCLGELGACIREREREKKVSLGDEANAVKLKRKIRVNMSFANERTVILRRRA